MNQLPYLRSRKLSLKQELKSSKIFDIEISEIFGTNIIES